MCRLTGDLHLGFKGEASSADFWPFGSTWLVTLILGRTVFRRQLGFPRREQEQQHTGEGNRQRGCLAKPTPRPTPLPQVSRSHARKKMRS